MSSNRLSQIVVRWPRAAGWVVCVFGWTVLARAEPPAAASANIERQRVPVAADGKWVAPAIGDYRAVVPSLFERWVTASQAKPEAADLAALTRSVYRARWQGSDVLSGSLEWEFHLYADDARLVPLAPCRLAMGRAVWRGSPSRSAIMGNDELGLAQVLVEGSGTLAADWSLRCVAADDDSPAQGTTQFVLDLPPCPVRELDLDLPAGAVPRVVGGVVLEGPVGKEGRRWRVGLASSGPVRLDLAATVTADAKSHVSLHEERSYRITPRGVELSATWTLDVQGPPLTELPLELPPGLDLVSAVHDGRELALGDAITNERGAAAAAASQQLDVPRRKVLYFATPLVGVDVERNVVRLRGIAPLRTGELSPLPAASSPRCAWVECQAQVETSAPLVLYAVDVRGGRVASEFLDGQAEIQLFEPGATVSALIDHAPSRTDLSYAQLVELSPSDVTCTVRLRATQVRGKRFELGAEIGSDWTVTSVEDASGAALRWSASQGGSDPRRLNIELAAPLTAGGATNALELTIRGQRDGGSAAAHVSPRDLTMLKFGDNSDAANLRERGAIGIRAAASHEWSFTNQQLAASLLSPDDLEVEVRRLLADAEGLILLDPRGPDAPLGLAFAPPARRIRADVETNVVAAADRLEESYVFHCVPERGAATEVVCLFSAPRAALLQWTLGGGVSFDELQARRLDSVEDDGDPTHPPGVEAWLVTLDRPRQAPFELRATRTMPWSGETPLSLAALADGVRQSARLQIYSPAGQAARISNLRLEPLWPEAREAAPGLQLRGTFAYQAQRDVLAASHRPAALSLMTPPGESIVDMPHVRLALLDTRMVPGEFWQHRARFEFEQFNGQEIRARLPQGWTSSHAQLNVRWSGRTATWRREGEFLVVTAANTSDQPLLEINFVTPSLPPDLVRDWTAPLPHVEASVARAIWRISVPDGVKLYALAADALDVDSRTDWLRRLLGPLAPSVVSARQPNITGVPLPSPWDLSSAQVFTTETTTADELRVRIVDERGLARWGFSAFPLTLLVAWRLGDYRRRLFWTMTALFAIVALAVPVWLTALTAPLALAWLLGCIAAWLLPLRTNTRFSDGAGRLAAPIGIVSASLALWLTVQFVQAQEPSRGSQPVKLPVLVPVDAQDGPIDTLPLLVPGALVEELKRTSARATRLAEGCLVEAASITGHLERDPANADAFRARLSAQFDLRCFSAASRLEISFFVSSDQAPPSFGRLNGRPVALTWNASTSSIAFAVPSSGAFRLEIDGLKPLIDASDDGPGFRGVLPNAPNTRLEMALPRGGPRLKVRGAVGEVRLMQSGRVVRAELGPTGSLEVRWQSANAEPMKVTHLALCQIRPGSVVVRDKFLLDFAGGWRDHVVLAVPARLTAFGKPRVDSVAVEATIREGATQAAGGSLLFKHGHGIRLLRIPIPGPPRPTVEIGVEFLVQLLPNVAGIGNLQVPLATVQESPDATVLYAVAVDQALRLQPGEAEEPAARDEFVALWADLETAETPIVRVARVLTNDSPPTLRIRPRPSTATVLQTTEWELSAGATRVRFEAEVRREGGRVFQQRISIPPELRAISVAELQQPTAELPWCRASESEISVPLPEAVNGIHHLVVTGELTAPLGKAWAPPRFQILDAQIDRDTLHVDRTAAAQVRIETDGPVATQENMAALIPPATPAGRVRTVGRWDLSEAAAPTFVLSANASRTEQATQWLKVRKDGDRWIAQVELRVRMASGQLDDFAFDAPADWTPRTLSSDDVVLVRPLPDPLRRQWRVTPQKPLAGETVLRLEAEPEGPSDSGSSLPDIRPGCEAMRYFVLPTVVDGAAVQWETSGMLPSRAMPPGEPGEDRIGPSEVFTASDPDSTVSARLVAVVSAHKVDLRLASHDLLLTNTSNGVGRSTFWLHPRGATSVRVRLPGAQQILAVTVGGRSVAWNNLVDGTLEAPLASANWPQALVVTYRCTSSSVQSRLQAPSIIGVQPRETTWRVNMPRPGPQFAEVAPRAAGRGTVDRQALAVMVNSGKPLLTSEFQSRPDFTAWFEAWATDVQLAGQDALGSANDEDARAAAEQLVTEAAEAARAAGLQDAWLRAAPRQHTKDANGLDAAPLVVDRQTVEFMLPGGDDAPTIRTTAAAERDAWKRWTPCALVLVILLSRLLFHRTWMRVWAHGSFRAAMLVFLGLTLVWTAEGWLPGSVLVVLAILGWVAAPRANTKSETPKLPESTAISAPLPT